MRLGRCMGWPDRSSQESKNPLLSNAGHAGMETACPICKRRLEAHDDGQMAECGLELMQRDYGDSYAEDFTWMCPECDGQGWTITTTPCWPAAPVMLVLGDYSGGACAE